MQHPLDLSEHLHPTQAAAASHHTGPALVIAGAGSGKTRTLIYRIAYLIEHYQVSPAEILAVTFTNKAAAEMRERAHKLIGSAANELWMSTFHSAGVRILRAYGEHIGLSRGFVIFDDDDQLDLIKSVMGDMTGLGPDPSPRHIRGLIDKAKSKLHTPEDLEQYTDELIAGFPKAVAAELYRKYEAAKRNQNAIDFNDLIVETIRLFQAIPEVLERVQSRAVFMHVDEYQDTNGAQYELTRLLASKDRNLLVVGDPDQSIYRFRGADIQNILDFQKDYPDAKVFRLEHNYRSSAKILRAANQLIEKNAQRLEKTLLAVKEDGVDIQFYKALDGRAEGDFVAEQVTRLKYEGYSLSDMAVLYRTNAQSRQIEDSLRRAQLPTKIIGGVGFYDRREIKDILAYARLALNHADDIALRRIIGRPKRGIGDIALGRLIEVAQGKQISLLQACKSEELLNERSAAKMVEFANLIDSMTEAAENYLPAEFFKFIIESSGYLELLKTEGQEGKVRLENLEELVNAAEEWSDDNPEGSILDFLDDSALLSSTDDKRVQMENKNTDDDAVTLMTMHNAKGLEFPVVFVVGLEQGLLPSRGALTEGAHGLEEERRLLYVAMTRAMQQLYLSGAQSRMQYGKTIMADESEFLEDVHGCYQLVNAYGEPMEASTRGKRSASNSPTTPRQATGTTTGNASMLADSSYRGGERVSHPKFGAGQVLAVAGMGQSQEVTVHFNSVGTKKLLVRFANLQKL